MYTSYRISEEVNLQTVLWGVAGGIVATARTLIAIDRRAATWRSAITQRLYADVAIVAPALWAVLVAALGLLWAFCGYAGKWAWAALPSLLYALVYMVGGLLIGAALLGVFAAICAIPPVVWPCLAGIAVFAFVTMPRAKRGGYVR